MTPEHAQIPGRLAAGPEADDGRMESVPYAAAAALMLLHSCPPRLGFEVEHLLW